MVEGLQGGGTPSPALCQKKQDNYKKRRREKCDFPSSTERPHREDELQRRGKPSLALHQKQEIIEFRSNWEANV